MTKWTIRPFGILMIASLATAPAQAQFGGLFGKKASPPATEQSESDDNGGCPKGKKGSSAGRSILGGVIGGALGGVAGRSGLTRFLPTAEVAGMLTDAIACRLDKKEQLQAATATEEATRGEAVGATSNWTSETRKGVSGSSTVVALNDESGGRRCMNVTDFVIVEGEETRVSKRMCKEPGQARYVIAAA